MIFDMNHTNLEDGLTEVDEQETVKVPSIVTGCVQSTSVTKY